MDKISFFEKKTSLSMGNILHYEKHFSIPFFGKVSLFTLRHFILIHWKKFGKY
jgi:hypothetical protein